MPFFLKTNTTDRQLAIAASIQLMSHFDVEAYVCKVDSQELYEIVLYTYNPNVLMQSESKNLEFLKALQDRVKPFSAIQLTQITTRPTIQQSSLPHNIKVNIKMRIGIVFSYDKSKTLMPPNEFAVQLQKNIYPFSKLILITSKSVTNFEIRVNQKAFLSLEDAQQAFQRISSMMDDLKCSGFQIESMRSDGLDFDESDHLLNGNQITRTTYFDDLAQSPIFITKNDAVQYAIVMHESIHATVNLAPLIFQRQELLLKTSSQAASEPNEKFIMSERMTQFTLIVKNVLYIEKHELFELIMHFISHFEHEITRNLQINITKDPEDDSQFIISIPKLHFSDEHQCEEFRNIILKLIFNMNLQRELIIEDFHFCKATEDSKKSLETAPEKTLGNLNDVTAQIYPLAGLWKHVSSEEKRATLNFPTAHKQTLQKFTFKLFKAGFNVRIPDNDQRIEVDLACSRHCYK